MINYRNQEGHSFWLCEWLHRGCLVLFPNIKVCMAGAPIGTKTFLNSCFVSNQSYLHIDQSNSSVTFRVDLLRMALPVAVAGSYICILIWQPFGDESTCFRQGWRNQTMGSLVNSVLQAVDFGGWGCHGLIVTLAPHLPRSCLNAACFF